MSLRNNQAGFSAFELALLVVVLGVLAVGALRVLNSRHDTTTSNTSVTTNGASKAPAVKTTKDLDKAAAVVDQNDPSATNASDSQQLDAQLSSTN
jgi:hypothetical protein